MAYKFIEPTSEYEVQFKIPGLKFDHIDTKDGNEVFTVVMQRLDVDWSSIEEALTRAGVPDRDASDFTEELAVKVSNHATAQWLAKNMRRIG